MGGMALALRFLRHEFRLHRQDLIGLVASLLVFAGYTAWRVQTYQSWVSNTTRVKAVLGLDTVERGFVYVAALLLSLVIPALFYAGAWPAIRPSWAPGSPLSLSWLCPPWLMRSWWVVIT